MQYFAKNELKENVQCSVFSLIQSVLNVTFIVKDDCIPLFCAFNENEHFFKAYGLEYMQDINVVLQTVL